MRRPLSIALLACIAALALPVHAQNYPTKTIHVISTFTAGSPADALARLIAQKMADSTGQAVVVDVMAGAGGIIGAQAVARAAPDGHTLLYTLATSIITSPLLVKTPPYELRNFTPIIVASKAATCMIAAVTFPPNNIQELVAYAKANPGKFAYGSNGIGGSYHLEMELLKQKYGVDITHVPYKGGTDALLATVAGTLPISFAPVSAAMPQVRAGKVKILAIMDYNRVAELPDVPSLGEQMPGYEKSATGVDFYGPGALPPAILKRVHAELVRAMTLPEVRKRMTDITFPYDGTGPEEMLAQRRKDLEVTLKAIKVAGLKPE